MKKISGMPGGKVSKTCGCEAKTRAAKDEPMGNNRNQAMKKACGSPCGIRKGCSKAQGSFKNLAEIVAGAPARLIDGGWLLLEHGYDQAVAARSLLADAGFAAIASWKDLAGIERVSGGRWLGRSG